LRPTSSQITLKSTDGTVSRDVDLAVVVDGTPRPFTLSRGDLHPGSNTLTAPPGADVGGHEFALRAELASDQQTVFVPGVGTVADRATVTGGALLVDTMPHPIAVVSPAGPLVVEAMTEEALAPGEPPRVSATGPARPADAGHLAQLDLVLAESSLVVWRELAELTGVAT